MHFSALLTALIFLAVTMIAQAEDLVIKVKNVEELIAAVAQAGSQDLSVGEVRILLAPGEYHLTELGSTGLALPRLIKERGRVVIKSEDPNSRATLFGGGPGSDYGLLSVRKLSSGIMSFLTLEDLIIRDFHTTGNGAVISASIESTGDIGEPLDVRLVDCSIKNVGASNGGVAHADGGELFNFVFITIQKCQIEAASATSHGGVAHSTGDANLQLLNNDVTNATAGNRGGALYVRGELAVIEATGNTIKTTHAGSQLGGMFYFNGKIVNVWNNVLSVEEGSTGDMVLAVGASPDDANIVIRNNTFLRVPTGGAGIADLGSSLVGAKINFWLNVVQTKTGGNCTLTPFASTDINFVDFGGNFTTDTSCSSFNHASDFEEPLQLKETSPDQGIPDPVSELDPFSQRNFNILIDLLFPKNDPPLISNLPQAGPTPPKVNALPQPGVLPCGYKDIRGLARPQDGDLDGSFDCDAGAYEIQGGANIGAAQSAAYFDIAHDQEGYFAEMLGGGLVIIGVFTFKRDGSGPAWYTGLGQVVGNSFVVDDLLLAKGGIFGAAFDAASITRTRVASFSANFPDCEATTNPGRWVIKPVDNIGITDPSGAVSDAELDTLLEEQIQVSTRLSQIVGCPTSDSAGGDVDIEASLETQSENAYRSGTYFNLARSGEGIFVEVLTDGTIVVMWYTFDPQGNPMWILATVAIQQPLTPGTPRSSPISEQALIRAKSYYLTGAHLRCNSPIATHCCSAMHPQLLNTAAAASITLG